MILKGNIYGCRLWTMLLTIAGLCMAVPSHAYLRLDDMASQPGLIQRSLPDDKQEDLTDSLTTDTVVIDTAAMAAVTDSLLQRAMEPRKLTPFCPDPIRAMWISLVFPGGGQIYNRKYWKLPIIYGGYLGCAYALTWNNMMLKDYSQAYLDIMDSDPNTKSYEKMLPMGYDITGKEDRFKEIFKNKKNHFRRFRDLSIFAFAGVYLLSVVDAYVDAELSSFDISQDLSMHVEPAMMQTYTQEGGRQHRQIPALSVSLNF